ncbi:MAG: radical SAM protein, partial [Deltaproteobacteria bacterium]|nr:radical SAM protein [Deltaproteobacteria bacterium]MBW2535059.1 radical SAM protein [Deltaproteobacteria bacterium]
MSLTARGVELLPTSLGTPESRLVVTAERRAPSRLDDVVVDPTPPDPTLDELGSLARQASPGGAFWLAGGEPTVRSDLPEIVGRIRARRAGIVGLVTDGLALTRTEAVEPLRRAGLSRVRIALHAAIPEAHDWLTATPGAALRALRGIRTCSSAGLAVEIEAALTRPTTPHLAQLAELAAHVGAAALHLRRLSARGPAADELVSLCPRLALLEPALEEAARVALRWRLPLAVHGLPRCAARLLDPCRVGPGMVRWLVSDDPTWHDFSHQLTEVAPGARCPACPGDPECSGASQDYVAAFGSSELASEDGLPAGGPRPTAAERAGEPVPKPP